MNRILATLILALFVAPFLAMNAAADETPVNEGTSQACATKEEEEAGTDTCGLSTILAGEVLRLSCAGTAGALSTSRTCDSGYWYLGYAYRYDVTFLFPWATGSERSQLYNYVPYWGAWKYYDRTCSASTPAATSLQISCTGGAIDWAYTYSYHRQVATVNFGACAAFCSYEVRASYTT